jgi:hypothetical protein
MVVKHYMGWKKFFTLIYWRIQLARIVYGQAPLNIISTFTIEEEEKG